MLIKTRREANGTYSYRLEGLWTPTEAVTATGARYQGQRMARWVTGFRTRLAGQPRIWGD